MVEFRILKEGNREKSSVTTMDFRKQTLARSGICSEVVGKKDVCAAIQSGIERLEKWAGRNLIK